MRKVDASPNNQHKSGLSEPQLYLKNISALSPTALRESRRLSNPKLQARSERQGFSPRQTSSSQKGLQSLSTSVIANILRFVPLQGLGSLRIDLPYTHDSASLLIASDDIPSRSTIASKVKNITDLHFGICDSSSAAGQRYYHIPPTVTQKTPPNAKYTRDSSIVEMLKCLLRLTDPNLLLELQITCSRLYPVGVRVFSSSVLECLTWKVGADSAYPGKVQLTECRLFPEALIKVSLKGKNQRALGASAVWTSTDPLAIMHVQGNQ